MSNSNNNQECLCLFLGCFGRTKNDIILCNPIKNNILVIDNSFDDIEAFVRYVKIVGLDKKPQYDYNINRRILNTLKGFFRNNKPFWDLETFSILDEFTINHKKCGIFISMELEKIANY